MDFLLKKFISTFFMPLSIVLILLLVGLFYLIKTDGKKGKLIIFFATILLFFISYAPFSNFVSNSLEQEYKAYISINKDIKYVVVLGNAHRTNKEQPNTVQLSSTAIFRLVEGIRIFKELNGAKLITLGYSGLNDSQPHATVLQNAAIELGVNMDSIIALNKPKDTLQEAKEVKKVVGNSQFILVTSATHMPRAMMIFKGEELNPIPAPTNFITKENSSFLSSPNASNIEKVQKSMHEYLGRIWYKLNKIF